MLKFLLKQPIHIWRTLERRQKIEIISLSGLVYFYLSERLVQYFDSMIRSGEITPVLLSDLLTHLFIIASVTSAPFIMMYLVPRQKGLRPFLGKPLTTGEVSAVIFYFSQKYQIFPVALFLPVLTSLIFSAGIAHAIYAVTLFTVYHLLIFILNLELLFLFKARKLYLTVMIIVTFIYACFYLAAYFLNFYTIIIDVIFLSPVILTILKIRTKNKSVHLELIFPGMEHSFSQKKAESLTFRNIPKLFPDIVQALFNKELLSLWRNPKYRRLKLITYIVYAAGLIFIHNIITENADKWITIWTLTIVWLHYSNSFNDKYALPDPDWYFSTVPFRFYQIWLSKFLVEFIYILLISATYWSFLLTVNTPFAGQLNLIGVLLIFSVMILSAMLNFQIMFYDEPRLAGFAYHFTVIFIIILSLNDWLVGPVIGAGLLIFFFYKSRRFFNT